MATLYNAIFEEIFNTCGSVVVHDFSQIKGITSNIQYNQLSPVISFCMSSIQKIFDEMIKVLKKARYNGSIILPTHLYLDRENSINLLNCVKTSHSADKQYIIVNENNEIALTFPRMEEKKTKKNNGRILFLPIDGLSSFAFGMQDFAIVLAYQELDEKDNFQTTHISFYNPLTKDIYTLSQNDVFSLNNTRLTNDNILQEMKNFNTIFVNNYEMPFSFDINKVASISNTFNTSNSIFLSICNLVSTNINLLIYKKGKDDVINTLIDFCINNSSIKSKAIGHHTLIGTNKVIENIKNT